MTWMLALALTLSLGSFALSQDSRPPLQENPDGAVIDSGAVARIDATLRGFVEAGAPAGVSVLIFEEGREAYFGAFGLANREEHVPMARNTIVQIYSMTKPIAGVALMMLHEEGAFDLDDPLSLHLPEFANLRVHVGTDAAGVPVLEQPRRAVTIRDITRHTAGFANGGDTPGVGSLWDAADPTNPDNSLDEFARRLATLPLWHHPGEQWAYGPAVDVQAVLVERLSGIPFEQFLHERILAPLRMTETSYLVAEAKRSRLAKMYYRSQDGALHRVPDEEGLYLATTPKRFHSGGYGLSSTLDDYARFARMLLNEGELDGVRILQPETVRLMATSHLSDDVTERSWLPSKGQVGFGINFAVRLRPPASTEENNGSVGEFFWDGAASTLFWVDPAKDLVAVLFTQLLPFDQIGLHKALRDAVYGPAVWPDGTSSE